MKLREIVEIVQGTPLFETDLEKEIPCGGAADLMSDVLALVEPGAILLTGLCNPQVVYTAEMADIAGIVFVRGKQPMPETVALAREKGIPLVTTALPMFEACGRLYRAGLRSCDITCRIPWRTSGDAEETRR
ncbi:MAG: hypothetical protein ACP5OO_06770 [Chloroflexia bacterium]